MGAESPWRVVLVLEGPSDLRRIRLLLDHLFEGERAYEIVRGVATPGGEYVPVKKVPELARLAGLSGRFASDGPLKGDGGSLRRFLQVLLHRRLVDPRTVVVWCRDDDGDVSRAVGLRAARYSLERGPLTVLGVASECGEAWVLAGVHPTTRDEKSAHAQARQRLGFDPIREPWRLSHQEDVERSAKRVLRALCPDQDDQDAALLRATQPEVPGALGCGLATFWAELVQWRDGPSAPGG